MKKRDNQIIPLLNSIDAIDHTLEFYTALGFDISYYQKSPYRFASVENQEMSLSFHGSKKFHPEYSPGGVYVAVPALEEVFNRYKENLKAFYGKIPYRGLPRISRINETAEDRRFTLTDCCGNYLIIGTPLSADELQQKESIEQATNKFEKRYRQAETYLYRKEDYRAALNTLEPLIHRHEDKLAPELLFQCFVLKIDGLIYAEQAMEIPNIYHKCQQLMAELTEKSHSAQERLDDLIKEKPELFS